MSSNVENVVSQESRSSAVLMWGLAILFGWISSLIFFMTKKEDAFVLAESKEALNKSLNMLIVMVVLSIVGAILGKIAVILATIVSLVSLVVWVLWVYICVTNLLAVKNNKPKPNLPIPFITLIK